MKEQDEPQNLTSRSSETSLPLLASDTDECLDGSDDLEATVHPWYTSSGTDPALVFLPLF